MEPMDNMAIQQWMRGFGRGLLSISPMRLDFLCVKPAIEILPRVLGDTNQINSNEEALTYFENLGRRPWIQSQEQSSDPDSTNADTTGAFIWRLISQIICRDEPMFGEIAMQAVGLLAYFNSSVIPDDMDNYLGISAEELLFLKRMSLISYSEGNNFKVVLQGSAKLRKVVRDAFKLHQISYIQTSSYQIRRCFAELIADFPDSDLVKRSMFEGLREFFWSLGLKYDELVPEAEHRIGRPVCKDILIDLLDMSKKERLNDVWLSGLIEQTMNRFKVIFGPWDRRTVDFTLIHLKALILTTDEPNYRRILNASKHYRFIFRRNFWRDRPPESPSDSRCGVKFVELMLSFANQCKDKIVKNRVLRETYRVCQMFFNFEVNYGTVPIWFSDQNLVSTTVDLMTCLKELHEILRIPPVLKQFRLNILPRTIRSDLELSLLLDFLLPLIRSRTSKIPASLKTALLEELFNIAKDLMHAEFHTPGVIRPDFSKCFFFFVKCGMEMKGYDQVLEKCKECNAGLLAALLLNSRISQAEEKSHVDYFELGITAVEVFECGLKIPDEKMRKLCIQESLSISINLIGFSHEYCDKLSQANENIVTNIIKCYIQLDDVKQFEHFITSYEEAVNLHPVYNSNPFRRTPPAAGSQAFPGLGRVAMLRFAKHILKYLKIPTTILYLPILKQVHRICDRYFHKVLLRPWDQTFITSARAIITDCASRVDDLYYESHDCPRDPVPEPDLFVSANPLHDDSILNILPPSRLSKLFYEPSSV